MATAVQVIHAPHAALDIWDWLKKNLFSPWYNAVLTVVTVLVLWSAGSQFFRWALNAKWKVVTDNLRLFMVGSYPPDQVWRVWSVVLMMGALLGLSAGIWGGAIRRIAYGFAVAYGLLALTQFGFDSQRWLLANAFTIVAGIVVARGRMGLRRFVLIGWLLSFFLTLFILYGFEKNEILPLVGTDKWGGLLLTFLLALVSIVVSFPLGVLLALGRRSKLPAVSIFSAVYIEVVRGVPLVTILFMAQIMVPLFFPEEMRLDRILRAMAGMTIFAAAYMAENVRGGLQSIPDGQIEAAKAIGLNNMLTTWPGRPLTWVRPNRSRTSFTISKSCRC